VLKVVQEERGSWVPFIITGAEEGEVPIG